MTIDIPLSCMGEPEKFICGNSSSGQLLGIGVLKWPGHIAIEISIRISQVIGNRRVSACKLARFIDQAGQVRASL